MYIKITIPSFYFEARPEPEMTAQRHWTRDWWDNHRSSSGLLTSDAGADELERGDFPNRNEAFALIQDLPLLEVSPAVADTVSTCISHYVLPADPEGNTLHLAVGSVHKCDFLLTRNCRHLANANKFAHIPRVNGILGLFLGRLYAMRDAPVIQGRARGPVPDFGVCRP